MAKGILMSLSLVLSLAVMANQANAAVQVSGRHIFILYPGVDSVWGSYILLVQNSGNQPERFSFPVMLPTEMIDFQGQDSLGPNELKLGQDRGLTVDKVFDPGDNLLNIGFKLPATVGLSPLTIKPATGFETLSMFVFEGQFEILGSNLEIRKGVDFSGRKYDTYTITNGEAGRSYDYTLRGIPEGRARLWIIGWIVGGAILLIALSLAWYTKPKLPDGTVDLL